MEIRSKNPLMRFRPYLRCDDIILFEKLREGTGLSMGKVLMALLIESETYLKLADNKDATPEMMNQIFMGLYSKPRKKDNKKKKESKCRTSNITRSNLS